MSQTLNDVVWFDGEIGGGFLRRFCDGSDLDRLTDLDILMINYNIWRSRPFDWQRPSHVAAFLH